jgi:hypothetical protein
LAKISIRYWKGILRVKVVQEIEKYNEEERRNEGMPRHESEGEGKKGYPA